MVQEEAEKGRDVSEILTEQKSENIEETADTAVSTVYISGLFTLYVSSVLRLSSHLS